jgi:hypothetical protein
MALALPVAVYLLALWFLHHKPGADELPMLGPLAAALILLTPFTSQPVVLTGVILVSLLAFKLMRQRKRTA